MNTMPGTTASRVTCSLVTPQNDQGRAKLVASITSEGVQVWCRWCKGIHLVPRAVCIAVWEQGKSVVEGCSQ